MVYKFFLINLIERPDRLKRAKQQIELLQIGNICIPKFRKHPKGGRIGCMDSHMKIWNHSSINDDDTVIIFEDDLQFCGKDPEVFWKRLEEAEALLDSEMCEVVNLSGQVLNYGTRLSRNFFKGINLTALAYVSKGSVLKMLPNRFYSLDNSHIDVMMTFQANIAIPYKQIFKQHDFNDSNNQWVRFKLFDSFIRKFMISENNENYIWNSLCNSIIKKNVAWYLLEDQSQ